jgi:thiol:disulfide interchange protein DsbD
VEPEETVQATSVLQALIFALAGGLILNIMPCVLPVIGLKILSFFQQAGQSRRQAFMLNVWYSLGILSVFLVLAVMGVALSRMFTEELFGIAMASVVFAMALSLMGVWEFQVPSFLGSGKTQELAGKEGAVGAFFKGIITTLLAIPCGAPLLSPALKWTDEQVRGGAPGNVYLIFCVIGIGMASPYLVIGAFPELLRWLPKPGPWMDTFRKAMGYFLLLAVVWILYFLPLEDMVPTVGLLFGLWIGCWLIGRPALTAPFATKAKAWLMAVGIVILTAMVCFFWLLRPAMEHRLEKLVVASVQDGKHDEAVYQRMFVLEAASLAGSPSTGGPDGPEAGSNTQAAARPGAAVSDGADSSTLRWHPFRRAEFERLIAEQKTVLVDFTADWCLTCKTLEKLVLNTDETREVVDANRVVTLQADWTSGAPEVTEMLKILGGEQVPVVAIFPAGNPNRPIVLRGAFSKQALREALEKAGPSKATM